MNLRLHGPQSQDEQSGDKKIPCTCWKSNHDSSGVQPVVYYHYANYISLSNGMKIEVRKY